MNPDFLWTWYPADQSNIPGSLRIAVSAIYPAVFFFVKCLFFLYLGRQLYWIGISETPTGAFYLKTQPITKGKNFFELTHVHLLRWSVVTGHMVNNNKTLTFFLINLLMAGLRHHYGSHPDGGGGQGEIQGR